MFPFLLPQQNDSRELTAPYLAALCQGDLWHPQLNSYGDVKALNQIPWG